MRLLPLVLLIAACAKQGLCEPPDPTTVTLRGVAKSGTTVTGLMIKAILRHAHSADTPPPSVTLDLDHKHVVPGLRSVPATSRITDAVNNCYDELRATNWSAHACPDMQAIDSPAVLCVRYPVAALVSWTFYAMPTHDPAEVVATNYEAAVKKLAVFYHWVTHHVPRYTIVHQHDVWCNPLKVANNLVDTLYGPSRVPDSLRTNLASAAVAASNFTALQRRERSNHPGVPNRHYRKGNPAEFVQHVPLKTLFDVERYVRSHLQPALVRTFEDQGYFDHEFLIRALHDPLC